MEIVIRAKKKWWLADIKELLHFRDLFYYLTWRDVKVKYKQTVVGVLWAVFQPFATMIVFSIFFGKLVGVPSDGTPYPIFVYIGLLFWNLFSGSLNEVAASFVTNERIITKVYFPRIILPVSTILTNVIDFLIAAGMFVILMAYFRFIPHWQGLLLLPVLFAMTVISTLGIGLLFASFNVKYRDVRYILPFFMQLLIFITPVIYPVSVVSAKYRWILGLNPMSGVIDVARSSLIGTTPIDWTLLGISCLCMVVYTVIGYFFFKKTERYFADVI